MSREIKFKAWDKVRKVMYDVDSIEMDILKDGSSDNQISGWDDVEWQCGIPLENVELLQYIGCKDIDGKEIYEGDIIERTDKTPVAEFYNKKEVGVVEYKNAQFVLKTGQDSYYEISYDGIFFTHMSDYKVIGNIYENKELLEVE